MSRRFRSPERVIEPDHPAKQVEASNASPATLPAAKIGCGSDIWSGLDFAVGLNVFA
jgi:hypothetical protein